MSQNSRFPPSLDDIAEIAEQVAAVLPEPFRAHIRHVVIRVAEFCDPEIEREMGLDSPFELLGLYYGVAISRRSVLDVPTDIDAIFLYRRPILDFWCETGEDLARVVRHVLIHEIGHHLGFSDDDMDAIETGR